MTLGSTRQAAYEIINKKFIAFHNSSVLSASFLTPSSPTEAPCISVSKPIPNYKPISKRTTRTAPSVTEDAQASANSTSTSKVNTQEPLSRNERPLLALTKDAIKPSLRKQICRFILAPFTKANATSAAPSTWPKPLTPTSHSGIARTPAEKISSPKQASQTTFAQLISDSPASSTQTARNPTLSLGRERESQKYQQLTS